MPAHRLSPFALAPLAALALACPAAAQKPADQVAIDQAIEWGVKYLRKEQKPAGFWGDGTGPGAGKGWGVGYTALAGMTLAECGVPPSDPTLKRAADIVRRNVGELDDTYEVALAILFLDRMKDRNDRRTIQWLAGRLIAAQMPSGGWGYKVPKHSEAESTQLLAALRRMAPPEPKKGDDPAKKPPFDPDKARKAALASLPPGMKSLAVVADIPRNLPADPKEKRSDLADATTDNSNTHFAMLGVWTARKYDVPADRTFKLVNRRYRCSQSADGTWAYDFARGAGGGGATTCVALLGVAIGHVVDPPEGVKPEADPVVLNALVALSKQVGVPAGDTRNRPPVKDVGGLYYLWTMERIAVLYDIQKLGKKDWYLWGAEILVGQQRGDGSWDQDGGFHGQHPVINTCFALLFLKRANLTPDLSKRLIVDPGVLTAKVDEKVAPKPEPPPPSPKVESPPEVAVAPMPREAVPKTQPVAQTVAPAAPAPELAAPSAPAKKSPLIWVLLGVLLVGLLGGLAFFALKRKKGGEDEDEEKPTKKGKGKKVKAGAEKPKVKKKVKAEVEEDEE